MLGQYGSPGAETQTGRFPWPDGKRVALSLSFDDARPSQLDNGVPILDRYGVHATFYVQAGSARDRADDWKRAAKTGHELGNHSEHHPCTGNFQWSRDRALENQDLKSIAEEIDLANRAITNLLGITPTTFAYPCGQKFVGRGRLTRSYVPVVAERFLAGRGWRDEGPNDPAFCDLAQLLGMELDGLNFEQAQALIDSAADQGAWLIFCGHDIGPEAHPQTTLTGTLEQICRYSSDPSSGIWIDSVDRIARYVQAHRSEVSQ
jgi:peptidoglycan/xylan/chitin deacetylase (PgdA/CDA1 family)